LSQQKGNEYRGADKSLARPGRITAHRALVFQKKLDYLGFQCLDLALSNYHLFPGLKKQFLIAHVTLTTI
jgi:hypothetical protein